MEPSFCRILCVELPKGPVFAQAVFPMPLVWQVFGPPERKGDGLLVWNFTDERGRVAFAIYCNETASASAGEFNFVSPVGDDTFFEWATEILNLTHNGDLPVAFAINRHRTVLHVERI